jgi:hypothetical protein
MVKVKLDVALCAGLSESVTENEKVKVPAAVGVPLIAPVEAFRLRPPGRLPPVTAHVYGVVPPVASSVAL